MELHTASDNMLRSLLHPRKSLKHRSAIPQEGEISLTAGRQEIKPGCKENYLVQSLLGVWPCRSELASISDAGRLLPALTFLGCLTGFFFGLGGAFCCAVVFPFLILILTRIQVDFGLSKDFIAAEFDIQVFCR